jgi:hypothetical protein
VQQHEIDLHLHRHKLSAFYSMAENTYIYVLLLMQTVLLKHHIYIFLQVNAIFTLIDMQTYRYINRPSTTVKI